MRKPNSERKWESARIQIWISRELLNRIEKNVICEFESHESAIGFLYEFFQAHRDDSGVSR